MAECWNPIDLEGVDSFPITEAQSVGSAAVEITGL